jgi:hypothetical protein
MLVVRAHQVSHPPCKCHTMYHKCIILYNDRDWLGHPVFKVQKPRYFLVSVEGLLENVCLLQYCNSWKSESGTC